VREGGYPVQERACEKGRLENRKQMLEELKRLIPGG
jgi:hypothetical protein